MTARLACRYHDGQIQWQYPDRETWFYKSRDDAVLLKVQFEVSAQFHKWFAPEALEYARQLEAAIKQYDEAIPGPLPRARPTSRDGPRPGDRPSTEYDEAENEDAQLQYETETNNAA